MGPGTVDSLARLLESAAPFATPRALALSLLREDRQYTRIAHHRREELIDAALDDGRRLAAETCTGRGEEPAAIAAACGLSVVECDAEAGWGTTLVYADYDERARRVRLYLPAIARLEHVLRTAAVSRIAGVLSARSMLLAHELYHHLDAVRGGPPLSCRHRVTLLSLGRWRWTSGLTSLSEIAAGAFAQRLLRLRWHPRFFDLIAMYERNPAAAAGLAAALRSDVPVQVTTDKRGFAT